MERKEFDIIVIETIKRLESIEKIKSGSYSLTFIRDKFYDEGLLIGCGEFYLQLGDGFHKIKISLLVNEKGKIFSVSFIELNWLVASDVKLLNTICEVLE